MLFLFPFFGLMTVLMHDQPDVSRKTEILSGLLAYTWAYGPVIWIICLILAVIEFKRRKREKRLTLYKRISWLTWGPHILSWLLFFVIGSR